MIIFILYIYINVNYFKLYYKKISNFKKKSIIIFFLIKLIKMVKHHRIKKHKSHHGKGKAYMAWVRSHIGKGKSHHHHKKGRRSGNRLYN